MRLAAALAVVLAFAGCTSEPDTTPQTPDTTTGASTTPTDAVTTSFPAAGDLSTATIDLLDGSQLEFTAPRKLALRSYFFFTEIPGLGESNVYLIPDVTPEEAAAGDDTEFHSDLGDGVKLWARDREGRPLFMTVEMDGWVAHLHVGWESPPETGLLSSLADQLRGDATGRGVILPAFDVEQFAVFLGAPDSEDSVQLWAGTCNRAQIPGSEVVEHPDHGELIRKTRYASWCEPDNDLEVSVSGNEDFVESMVSMLTLKRDDEGTADGGAATSVAGRLPDGTEYQLEFEPALESVEATGIMAAVVLDLEDEPDTRQELGCVNRCRAVAIGVTTFSKEETPGPSFEEGTFHIASGDWTMSLDIYQDILELWGDRTDQILTDSITPIDTEGGLPAYTIEPPLRWGTDTELPLQMEVDHGSFVVRRACGELSVACSADGEVQVIPAEEVSTSADEWDHSRTVTVGDATP